MPSWAAKVNAERKELGAGPYWTRTKAIWRHNPCFITQYFHKKTRPIWRLSR